MIINKYRNNKIIRILILLVVAVFLPFAYLSAETRIPVGLSYTHGFSSTVDAYKDNRKAEGRETGSQSAWPVGLSANPYYLFNNGITAGISLGPASLITGGKRLIIFPAGICAGYSLKVNGIFSPYARAGFRYPFACGDYIKKSYAGLYGSMGAEVSHILPVTLGTEISYSTASVDFENSRNGKSRRIHTDGFGTGIFAVFSFGGGNEKEN